MADSWRGLQTPPLCGDHKVCNPSPIPYENNIPHRRAVGYVDLALSCDRYTYADYKKWEEDFRCELIDLLKHLFQHIEHALVRPEDDPLAGDYRRGEEGAFGFH